MLPPEIIDHIFSFLRKDCWWTDLDSLESCSTADPVLLAPIADRYFYRSITITNGGKLSPTLHRILEYTYLQMKDLLSENPLIANHVRILHIQVYNLHDINLQHSIIPLLPFFTQMKHLSVGWLVHPSLMSADFISAVDRCMRLPSLVDVVFNFLIPLHLLNKWKCIKTLTFGPLNFATIGLHSKPVPDTTDLQLESLSFLCGLGCYSGYPTSYVSWAKNHVRYLRSLSFQTPFHKCLLELFAVCSTTLTSLELDFLSNDFQTTYDREMVTPPPSGVPFALSSLPYLQELTIYPHITFLEVPGSSDMNYRSSLPAVIDLVKTSGPLQRLVLDFVFHGVKSSTLPKVDLSSMAVFANSSFTFRQMEIRMSQGFNFRKSFPAATVLSYLMGHEELMELYGRGVLLITGP